MHDILQGQAPAAVVGSGVQTLWCSACSLEPSRCAHCRLPFSPGAECRIRCAQQAAIEQIAVERAVATEGQRKARKEALQTLPLHSDGSAFPRLWCSQCGWPAMTDNAMDAHLKAVHGAPVARDEMRGGLHALEAKGFIGRSSETDPLGINSVARGHYRSSHEQRRAPGKGFARSEILAVLRACRADAGNVADAEYARLIAMFERME